VYAPARFSSRTARKSFSPEARRVAYLIGGGGRYSLDRVIGREF
jgi:hypothetical protein